MKKTPLLMAISFVFLCLVVCLVGTNTEPAPEVKWFPYAPNTPFLTMNHRGGSLPNYIPVYNMNGEVPRDPEVYKGGTVQLEVTVVDESPDPKNYAIECKLPKNDGGIHGRLCGPDKCECF